MKKKNIKVIKKSSLLLLCGVALTTASCQQSNDHLFFTIKGKDLEVTFCDRGASIYSIKYKNQYVTYQPKDKTTFLKNDYYYGKALGRVAGRIRDGKLKVGEKEYQLEVNETSGQKHNSLHGGTNGFVARDFKHYIEETTDCYRVSFNYVSPALEAGFPEVLDSWFVYTISKKDSVIDLNITATSTGTTPVNLSTHPYFRLGEEGDILEHTLEVPADNIAQYDMTKKDQVVTGLKSVKDEDGKPWDFTTAKKVGADIQKAKELDEVSGGYDHIWKFNGSIKEEKYVKLTNPKTKITLTVNSDADAVIMYANCYPHDKEKLEMNPQGIDTLYGGITIEPYKFFTKDTVSELNITPDKPFSRNITYKFSTSE